MSNVPAEVEYTILTDLLNTHAVGWSEMLGRCRDIKVTYYDFILSVIINLIYSEIVYMKIVTFCTENFYFDMLMEKVGFEPEILRILDCSAKPLDQQDSQQTFLLELYLHCCSLVL
jgi:hypothetical protein